MNTCKNCNAPMIPGIMSAGWCSAECDIPKLTFDCSPQTGQVITDGEVKIYYDGVEYIEVYLLKEFTYQWLLNGHAVDNNGVSLKHITFIKCHDNPEYNVFHIEKAKTKPYLTSFLDAEIGCQVREAKGNMKGKMTIQKQRIDFAGKNYGSLP